MKFRDLRVGDRFMFRRIGSPIGRFVKQDEARYVMVGAPLGLRRRARGGEAVEKLPPEPTTEDVAEVAGLLKRRDAGVK